MTRSGAIGRLLALGALGALAVTAGCARTAPGLSDADKAAIAASAESLTVAMSAGDAAKWVSYYTENAVVMPPNMDAVQGKAAIEALIATFPPMSGVRVSQVMVDGAGDLAVVQGTYEMTLTMPNAPGMQDRGKYLEVWRRQADGRWLIAHDMFSTNVPLPAPEAPAKP